MKWHTFLILFILTNIIFIVLHIHRHTLLVKLSYQHQRLSKEKNDQEALKNSLLNQLHELQKPSTIKKSARTKLNMQPIPINNITTLKIDE